MQARGKSEDDVAALLDAGVYDMQKLADGGWVTGLKYADEVKTVLQERSGGKADEVAAVPLRRYKYGAATLPACPCDGGGLLGQLLRSDCASGRTVEMSVVFVADVATGATPPRAVDSGAFGLKGRKKIAIVRESGAITGARREQGGQITTEPLIKKLRALAKQKSISGIVLRVDSPGARLRV